MPAVDYDLICLSHLRWDFVFQRPQHLLTRCARDRNVLFIEEPIFGAPSSRLEIKRHDDGVQVVVPHLPHGLSPQEIVNHQRQMLDVLMARRGQQKLVLWYYTPMALPFSKQLQPLVTVYDCMDELANFQGAPPLLRQIERELLSRADLVFTGGHSLYEAKRPQHPRVYQFPSSVDVPHFAEARRSGQADPPDQAAIKGPRLGFFGVIDERMDLALLDAIATKRPDWQLVMLGPVVKIDPASLPRHENIHWLGGKSYKELPRYIAGWDVALLPFAQNDATRYISPTKTPEYLAAGKPVVSTPIRDVIRPYGEMGLAEIAGTPAEFIAAIQKVLNEDGSARQRQADSWLSQLSWDRTWGAMQELIDNIAAQRGSAASIASRQAFPPSALTPSPASARSSQVREELGAP